jgi:hypothetical protein
MPLPVLVDTPRFRDALCDRCHRLGEGFVDGFWLCGYCAALLVLDLRQEQARPSVNFQKGAA